MVKNKTAILSLLAAGVMTAASGAAAQEEADEQTDRMHTAPSQIGMGYTYTNEKIENAPESHFNQSIGMYGYHRLMASRNYVLFSGSFDYSLGQLKKHTWMDDFAAGADAQYLFATPHGDNTVLFGPGAILRYQNTYVVPPREPNTWNDAVEALVTLGLGYNSAPLELEIRGALGTGDMSNDPLEDSPLVGEVGTLIALHLGAMSDVPIGVRSSVSYREEFFDRQDRNRSNSTVGMNLQAGPEIDNVGFFLGVGYQNVSGDTEPLEDITATANLEVDLP